MVIPSHGHEYLHIITGRLYQSAFGTPTRMGPKYYRHGVGDYELKLEVGSDSVAVIPTRVRIVYTVGAHRVELKQLDPFSSSKTP